MHHPWFLKAADEADEYFNIPAERRTATSPGSRSRRQIPLLRPLPSERGGARWRAQAITTGPVGMPLAEGQSGLRIVIVRDDGITHRYYHFGELPSRVNLEAVAAAPKP